MLCFFILFIQFLCFYKFILLKVLTELLSLCFVNLNHMIRFKYICRHNHPKKPEFFSNLSLDNLPIVKYKTSMWIEHAPTTVPFPHGGVFRGRTKSCVQKT